MVTKLIAPTPSFPPPTPPRPRSECHPPRLPSRFEVCPWNLGQLSGRWWDLAGEAGFRNPRLPNHCFYTSQLIWSQITPQPCPELEVGASYGGKGPIPCALKARGRDWKPQQPPRPLPLPSLSPGPPPAPLPVLCLGSSSPPGPHLQATQTLTSVSMTSPTRKEVTDTPRMRTSLRFFLRNTRGCMSTSAVTRLSTHTNCRSGWRIGGREAPQEAPSTALAQGSQGQPRQPPTHPPSKAPLGPWKGVCSDTRPAPAVPRPSRALSPHRAHCSLPPAHTPLCLGL